MADLTECSIHCWQAFAGKFPEVARLYVGGRSKEAKYALKAFAAGWDSGIGYVRSEIAKVR